MYSLVPRSFGWSLGGSKCGCRGISSSAIRCREEVSRQPKVTVGEVMRNEERGTFRTLDIGKPKFRMSDEEFQKKLQRERGQQSTAFLQDRELEMSPHQDWQSIWPATRTFQPSVVPLPIRQGYIHLRNQVHPGKYANAELMKIPNFLHLTPPVVRKQAESLRQFCTPFPKEDLSHEFPLKEITSSYLNASSSIRDHRARVVELRIPIKALKGTPQFADKLKRLLRERYNATEDTATIVTDVCPRRSQNQDYAAYLLTALFHESRKVESWESSKTEADMVNYDYEFRERKGALDPSGKPKYVMDMKFIMERGENEESLKKYKESVLELFDLKDDKEEKKEGGDTKN